MNQKIKEVVRAYKKEYIELAAESRWHDQRPLGGLREDSGATDGRMRALRRLSDFREASKKLLGLSDKEIERIEAQCEKRVAARTARKVKEVEKARKKYRQQAA